MIESEILTKEFQIDYYKYEEIAKRRAKSLVFNLLRKLKQGEYELKYRKDIEKLSEVISQEIDSDDLESVSMYFAPSYDWTFQNTIHLDATGDLKFRDSQDMTSMRILPKSLKNIQLIKYLNEDLNFTMTQMKNKDFREDYQSYARSLINTALSECEKILCIFPKDCEYLKVIDSDKIYCTSYGSNTVGSNDYIDCDGVILLENYKMNPNALEAINKLTKSNSTSEDWTIDTLVQCIGRSKIRTDYNHLVKVYTTETTEVLDMLISYDNYPNKIHYKQFLLIQDKINKVRKNFRNEIIILYKYFRESFEDTKKIEITLSDLMNLVVRNEKKRKVYDNLVDILKKEFEIDLIIL